jgi:hypothetical protein
MMTPSSYLISNHLVLKENTAILNSTAQMIYTGAAKFETANGRACTMAHNTVEHKTLLQWILEIH